MRALYEIDADIMNCVDEETGEILDKDRLDQLSIEREKKIEGVSLWYKNLVAEAEMVKIEKMNLAARQSSLEKKAESVKEYLAYALGGETFTTGKVQIKYTKSTALEIAEGAEFPDEFWKIEKTPKKTELKEALKAGAIYKGVSLVSKQNMQIK